MKLSNLILNNGIKVIAVPNINLHSINIGF
jgi:hypothetical protein